MTFEFQIRGVKDDGPLRRQMEADLKALGGLMAVTSARITLQHQSDATPPYQAVAMLAVTGPDLHAAARDHTGIAAWRKVVTRLREQMEQRRREKAAPPPQPAGRRGN